MGLQCLGLFVIVYSPELSVREGLGRQQLGG